MKYDTIGVGYDATRRPDPRIAERILALLEPVVGGHYLHLACGTGNYTHPLHALGLDVVDQSTTMLEAARAKYPAIKWQQADVTDLPFLGESFDGAICTQAIHHFPDLGAAFRAMRRVLRGGRLVMFTSTRVQMRSSWLNAYFPKAMGARSTSCHRMSNYRLLSIKRSFVSRRLSLGLSPMIQSISFCIPASTIPEFTSMSVSGRVSPRSPISRRLIKLKLDWQV
jgi:ubiquinone/menaquinone biosynthesis C-methylase UbiE